MLKMDYCLTTCTNGVLILFRYPVYSSYSLLVHIIGKETGFKPRNLYISLGDTHVYEQYIDAVKEQLKRVPSNFPQLEFLKKKIKDYNYENFINKPHKTIKVEMIA